MVSMLKMRMWAAIMSLALITAASVSGAAIYVNDDAAGSNNGTSWANAFVNLQDALGVAVADDEIWVAAGSYQPDLGTAYTQYDRQVSFTMITGVALYGGFAGTETQLSQRDYVNNVTILTGDLAGNDSADFGNMTDNSYHILTANNTDATAILDGFTITGGYSNGASPDNCGSGLRVSPGSPTVQNCVFTNHWSTAGGSAIWANTCPSQITNCVFENCYGGFAGAVYFYSNSSGAKVSGCTFDNNIGYSTAGGIRIRETGAFTLEDCTFTNNTNTSSGAAGGGAVIVTSSAFATITNCSFENNSSSTRAGALLIDSSSGANVTNCAFTANNAPYGGATRLTSAGNVTFDGCTFSENTCTKSGAAVFLFSAMSGDFINCCFYANDANEVAGALSLDGSGNSDSTLVANCVFTANNANTEGGAIKAYDRIIEIDNCVFVDNTAPTGAAVTVASNSLLDGIYNSIILNGASSIDDQSAALEVSYCNIENGWTGAGTGNIDQDPLFVDADGADDIPGTADDDYHLQNTAPNVSPCIDAGGNSYVPASVTEDKDGRKRIINGIVDMGIYEVGGCGDANHPIPDGDINGDCRVDLTDFSVISANWLTCTAPECE